MFDIITIGGATRDIFFITDKGRVFEDMSDKKRRKFLAFEYGSKLIPEQADFAYGGGGANTAISFSKIGLKVATILRVGAEGTGSLITKELEAAGVNCHLVERDSKNHTALSVIVSVPKHDHTMFLHRGANDYLEIRDWRHIKTNWIYLSSLTGDSTEIIPEVFSYIRAHRLKIAWNPGSEQLKGGFADLSSYLELTDILILNKAEAISLVLSKNNRINIRDEKEILQALFEMTDSEIVMTAGEEGSYVTDGRVDYFEPVLSEEVVETTGAGDSYGSTFVAFRILGYSIKDSMKLATYNAGNVIKYMGAQKGLMTFDELRSKIEVGVK